METTYFTLTAREIIVSGDAVAKADAVGAPARQLVCVRQPRITRREENNVINLADWKAAREEEARLEDEWYGGVDERLESPAVPEARPRREHRPALLPGSELLATLSIVGAMAVLMVKMLVF